MIETIERLFEENFAQYGELGAAISIWKEGSEVLSLHGGHRDRNRAKPWNESTLVQIWSCSKGVAGITFVHFLEQHGIEVDATVAHFWPEFGANGKSEITLRQVLAHQAGLSAMETPMPDAFDKRAVCDALARQAPLWEPGSAHGYHARTHGYLLDGIVERIAPGETIGNWWRKHFGDPLEIDIYFGLPEELHHRVADLSPAKGNRFPDKDTEGFAVALGKSGSITQRTMTSPAGLSGTHRMNSAEARSASIPSFTGIASARGLGKFYGMLADVDLRRVFVSEEGFRLFTERSVNGPDLVLQTVSAFGAGVMLDPLDVKGRKVRSLFGPSISAFGHPGAGGSHAFADPERCIGFAYVMNQMEMGLFPNLKSMRIVDALTFL